MSSQPRDRILDRLNAALSDRAPAVAVPELPPMIYTEEEKLTRLKSLLEAVNTEVHLVTRDNWTATLKTILRSRQLDSLLYAPQTSYGPELEAAWRQDNNGLPQLTCYEETIESFKETLFRTDAAITTSVGAIAENGAVVLWPDTAEPRLMSLVPPVHIALVEASSIYSSFDEIIQAQGWTASMPTNVVLISGPSKTADIELVLTYGVHGPKAFIVLILQ